MKCQSIILLGIPEILPRELAVRWLSHQRRLTTVRSPAQYLEPPVSSAWHPCLCTTRPPRTRCSERTAPACLPGAGPAGATRIIAL